MRSDIEKLRTHQSFLDHIYTELKDYVSIREKKAEEAYRRSVGIHYAGIYSYRMNFVVTMAAVLVVLVVIVVVVIGNAIKGSMSSSGSSNSSNSNSGNASEVGSTSSGDGGGSISSSTSSSSMCF